MFVWYTWRHRFLCKKSCKNFLQNEVTSSHFNIYSARNKFEQLSESLSWETVFWGTRTNWGLRCSISTTNERVGIMLSVYIDISVKLLSVDIGFEKNSFSSWVFRKEMTIIFIIITLKVVISNHIWTLYPSL